jgi:hypothetical protein
VIFSAAALVVMIASAGLATASPAPTPAGRWLNEFPAFPGARRLCSQHVLGESQGKRVEIAFAVYATSADASTTARFYAEAYRLPFRAGETTITVRRNEGRRLLSVHPASEHYPECGVKPGRGEPTVIVVSERTP